jgi:hypothetical protein
MNLLTLAALMLLAMQGALAEVQTKTVLIGATTVEYKIVLPKGYDPAKAYPAVLAFGGGPQTMSMVDVTLHRTWQRQAEARGYIVILPAAPDGVLFYLGGEKIFPEFIKKMLATYKIQDNKFYAAGYSNGGISAFQVAELSPQDFLSITAFPGYLLNPTPARLRNISGLCINMYVGALDRDRIENIEKQSEEMSKFGLAVKLSIEKGQGHIIQTLAGDSAGRLFDDFREARHGCTMAGSSAGAN